MGLNTKNMFLSLCLAVALAPFCLRAEDWWNDKWESRITFKVVCGAPIKDARLPFVLRMSALELGSEVNQASFKVVGAKGQLELCQFDDKNGDGKLDNDDELVMSLPIDKRNASYSIYYSVKKNLPPFPSMASESFQWNETSVWASLDNGLVKIECNAKTASKQQISLKTDVEKWTLAAQKYYDEYKIDKKWGATVLKSEFKRIGTGPVRSVLRQTWNMRSGMGKPFQFIKEWSLFSNSNEIMLRYEIVNTGKYPLAWGYRNNGFYDVLPKFSDTPQSLRFAGNDRAKLAAGELGMRIFSPKTGNTALPWYDVSTTKIADKTTGFGCVIVKPRPLGRFLGLVGKTTKRLRMTENYISKGKETTIYPGKSARCVKWYIPHKGNYKKIELFRNALANTKLTLLGQMNIESK
jgi:hypothetical protein